MEQQSSLDAYAADLASAARDHGLTASAGNDPDWTSQALELIWQLPAGSRISADDIRADLGRSSAMGAVFHRAREAGWITCVGLIESRVVTRRKGAQRLWERLP